MSRRCELCGLKCVSSASTFQGSRARRNSSSTPSAAIEPIFGKRNSKCEANHFSSKSGSRIAASARGPRRKVALHKVRQHEAVVKRRAPANQPAFEGLSSKSATKARTKAHSPGSSHMWRHFEGTQLEQAKATPDALEADIACRYRTPRDANFRSRRRAGCETIHPERTEGNRLWTDG